MSKTIEMVVALVTFAVLSSLCGNNISKRNWEQSVAYFLLALGTILLIVKSTPSL
jgi:VIT1/CCC1 family predicted Fe2+/Mn2+ transporter